MKRSCILIILSILIGSFTSDKGKFLEEFKIGRFSYRIYKKHKYLHDDNVNVDYFVVYAMNGKSTCSSFMLATRNDSVLTRGCYNLFKNRIEFREYNTKTLLGTDSIIKEFYTNHFGTLILKKCTEFQGGKARGINLK